MSFNSYRSTLSTQINFTLNIPLCYFRRNFRCGRHLGFGVHLFSHRFLSIFYQSQLSRRTNCVCFCHNSYQCLSCVSPLWKTVSLSHPAKSKHCSMLEIDNPCPAKVPSISFQPFAKLGGKHFRWFPEQLEVPFHISKSWMFKQ